jgi:hypothetical protein
MIGSQFYKPFLATDWTPLTASGGTVTFNPDGSIRLTATGAGSFGKIGGVVVTSESVTTDLLFLLHGLSWTIPVAVSGNHGRLRTLLRDAADTFYLSTGYVSRTLDGQSFAVPLNGSSGIKVLSIDCSYNEGGSDIDVTIQRWSILFGNDIDSIAGGGVRLPNIRGGADQ